ncbi:MAG: gamma carbonic anhydrase family protein, partial [Clostridia bacterium]|nr:gamma carbonic anhydrase family protein [Clostridia bacterium]
MKQPTIHPTAWVAQGAVIKGEVTLHEHANVWYNAVLRGDTAPITVGKNSNV